MSSIKHCMWQTLWACANRDLYPGLGIPEFVQPLNLKGLLNRDGVMYVPVFLDGIGVTVFDLSRDKALYITGETENTENALYKLIEETCEQLYCTQMGVVHNVEEIPKIEQDNILYVFSTDKTLDYVEECIMARTTAGNKPIRFILYGTKPIDYQIGGVGCTTGFDAHGYYMQGNEGRRSYWNVKEEVGEDVDV